jgi:hypothetical protein
MSALRIVLAHGSLVRYPEGGGNWMCFLQHFLGLRGLGHDVYWLALFNSKGDRSKAERYINVFFDRMKSYGLDDRCAVLLHDDQENPSLDTVNNYGMSKASIEEVARTADLLWNFANSLKPSVSSVFRRRVLIDLDPGLVQVGALSRDMGQNDHEVFLSVGSKLHDPDCEVPTLGLAWHKFLPPVYLPLWNVVPAPRDAPFTSITEWNWGDMTFAGRQLSISKRDAYCEYLELARRTGQPLELAANICVDKTTDERQILTGAGWRWVDPHQVAGTPSAYQQYISGSRAEICCPKPIYRQLKTGWLSDRSAAYLASGRPVLMGETGISDHFPTDFGLTTFQTLEDAAGRICEINRDYTRHCHAARNFAEEFLDSRRCLGGMLSACGY